jgi:hypothetical protein
MPFFQCVAAPYPEEMGGLFRLNGRCVPRKRAGRQKGQSNSGLRVGLFRGNGRTIGRIPVSVARRLGS